MEVSKLNGVDATSIYVTCSYRKKKKKNKSCEFFNKHFKCLHILFTYIFSYDDCYVSASKQDRSWVLHILKSSFGRGKNEKGSIQLYDPLEQITFEHIS